LRCAVGGRLGARVDFHPVSSLVLATSWQQGGAFDAIEGNCAAAPANALSARADRINYVSGSHGCSAQISV
jgi:hypothetical protein